MLLSGSPMHAAIFLGLAKPSARVQQCKKNDIWQPKAKAHPTALWRRALAVPKQSFASLPPTGRSISQRRPGLDRRVSSNTMQQATAALAEELGLLAAARRREGALARAAVPDHPLDPLSAVEYEQASS